MIRTYVEPEVIRAEWRAVAANPADYSHEVISATTSSRVTASAARRPATSRAKPCGPG